MTVINSTIASAVSHALAGRAATQTASSTSSDNFGAATNVTLSPTAQAAASAPAPAPSPPSGGSGIPIASSTSTSTDSALEVALAKAQVIPKVGVSGASDVVDSKGDIDQVKLAELEAQQEAKAAAQKNQA